LFWIFAIGFFARTFRKAHRRAYIGTDVFELNRIPIYMELLRIKEQERNDILAQQLRDAQRRAAEASHLEKREKYERELMDRLVDDDELYELRMNRPRPVYVKTQRWAMRSLNDQSIIAFFSMIFKRKPKPVKPIVEEAVIDDTNEEKLSAWDKYPPTYADLPLDELNIVAGRNELNFYKLIKERKVR